MTRFVLLAGLVAGVLVGGFVGDLPPATAAPAPPVVWSRTLSNATVRESSPVLVDLDGSGTLDVAFGGHDKKLYVLDGRTGAYVKGWPVTTTHRVNSSPAAADVTRDGVPELFVGAGMGVERSGAFYSFTAAGGTRFRQVLKDPDFPAGAPVQSSPAVGDISGDGVPDATVGALGVRSLWSFRGTDGAPLRGPGKELFYWDDTIFSSAALADVNGDGVPEAIIGGDSTPGPPVDWRGGMVRAVTGAGASLWEFRINDIVRSSPSVGDIDGDGRLEVVFGAGDYYHASDRASVFAVDALTGRLKWRRATNGVTNASPTLADANGDGRLDVVFGTFSGGAGLPGGSVYVLDGRTGKDLPGFPQATGGGVVLGQVVTADVDGDGGQDLFVPTGAYIAVFSGRTGAKLFNLAEGQRVGFQNSPAVADVDGNGRLDVLAVGTQVPTNAGVAYRWELPAPARLGNLGWHQYRKDASHTGSWTSRVPVATTLPFRRVSGDDRYRTAVAVSEDSPGGGPGSGSVYVATGVAFADALAGGPAAASDGAPVLLVTRDALPEATRERLLALRPARILVLGGPAAVSDAVLAQLAGLASGGASRIAGNDRYETAAAVSAQAFGPLVPVAYVATGASFPDALAGAAAGAAKGGPVLLVQRDAIPTSVAVELRRLAPRSIVILGGTGAVSEAVATQLRTYSVSVSRAAGADRYGSGVAVAQSSFPGGASVVYVATATNFPDALAGGALAGRSAAPLLLVPGTCVPLVVREELTRLGATQLVLLGGPGAVSGAVAALNPCMS
jgi:putative cell wall-binding protein